eukprot:TRINITY_DN761_c0_g1_i5.p1 TRINITY_DN761_c0_g1~~TRINITY_DN761_c0_g1_i5.p1  ORF type:complete len:371 (+),score=28.89 TRINITY_DN761_c0_g1_i5:89-1114(+)
MELKEAKVLVTGATGFLGAHIILQLLQKRYLVRGTVRDKSNEKKLAFLKTFPSLDHLELVEADLLKPLTLQEAVKGCDYVIHTASPFPADSPSDESFLIKPALEGTVALLKACNEAKCVKHVVITSSIVAITNLAGPAKPQYDENDWADPEDNTAYNKSKILAERAAWELYRTLENRSFKMTVINPGFILGPSLFAGDFTSADRIKKLMSGELKFLPKIAFCVVDVRDVAAAHILAIEKPETDNNRYICYSGESCWFEEIAAILREECEAKAVPTFVLQECPIKDPKNPLAMHWGKMFKLDNGKIKADMGITFRSAKEAVIEMANSLKKFGMISQINMDLI